MTRRADFTWRNWEDRSCLLAINFGSRFPRLTTLDFSCICGRFSGLQWIFGRGTLGYTQVAAGFRRGFRSCLERENMSGIGGVLVAFLRGELGTISIKEVPESRFERKRKNVLELHE